MSSFYAALVAAAITHGGFLMITCVRRTGTVVENCIKAIFRGRGIACGSMADYDREQHRRWLHRLSTPAMRLLCPPGQRSLTHLETLSRRNESSTNQSVSKQTRRRYRLCPINAESSNREERKEAYDTATRHKCGRHLRALCGLRGSFCFRVLCLPTNELISMSPYIDTEPEKRPGF